MSKDKSEDGLYITDYAHFKDAQNDPNAPKSAQQMARFLAALIESSKEYREEDTKCLETKIPCMSGPGKKWCLGLLTLTVDGDDPPEILWECRKCGKAGVIRNF